MTDFINGNGFAEAADYVVTLDQFSITPRIEQANVIFCKTEFFPKVFHILERIRFKSFIVITGMADKTINRSRYESKPKSIRKWFGVNTTYEADDLISIPLGIENHMGKSKGGFTVHKWFAENVVRLCEKPKEDLFYCNWKNDTNPKARVGLVGKLKRILPIRHDKNLTFADYCDRMSDCKYVICPPGNGVDTHRVWEALYLGCIPIVLKNRIYDNYDLPIIQVDNFTKIKPNELLDHRCVDYKQLHMSYWKERIRA